jgi:peptidoglycan hydrolase CwlO-like protein
MTDLSTAASDSPPPQTGRQARNAWVAEALGVDCSSISGENFKLNRAKLGEKLAADRKGLSEVDYQEDRAGRILQGMEKATHANQTAKMPNAPPPAPDAPSRPLAHAVSGHGKGTDQMSRLLNGRRADQTVEENKLFDGLMKRADALIAEYGKAGKQEPGAKDFKDLDTETDTLSKDIDTFFAKSATVGSDPSNVSGAFKTHGAMLDAVREGFTQADMAQQFGNSQRADGVDTNLGDARFVTKVRGVQGGGESLEIKGMAKQGEGLPLGAHEQEERARKVEVSSASNASVVLDPAWATNDKGEYVLDNKGNKVRAGWNLQTAYPVKGEVGPGFQTPSGVDGSRQDLEGRLAAEKKKVEPFQAKLEEARKELKDKNDAIASAKATLASLQKELDQVPKGETADTLKGKITDLEKRIAALQPDDSDEPMGNLFGGDDEPSEPSAPPEADPETLAKIKELNGQLDQTKDWLAKAQKKIPFDLATASLQNLEGERDTARQKVAAAGEEVKVASQTMIGLKTELQSKSSGGGETRATGCYDPVKGLIAGERPAKPATLRGTDEEADPLTANHLYPWNKIMADLNSALSSQSRGDMQKLLDFGDFKVDASFWEDLAKPPAERSHDFSETINRAAQAICWAPQNIFMGPKSDKRGDDPGEKRDAAFTKSGIPTPESAMAEMMDKEGGITGTRTGAAAIFERNLREARKDNGAEARKYDTEEWTTDEYGKRVRRQGPDGKAPQ